MQISTACAGISRACSPGLRPGRSDSGNTGAAIHPQRAQMTAATATIRQRTRFFLGLCKLRVVSLIVFTAVVGMALSVPGMIPLDALIWGTLGIGMAAASAAAINHLLDERADRIMARTRNRPLPSKQLNRRQALIFALILAAVSMLILVFLVNPLTAVLTFISLIGYAVIYTAWLKRATSQNIVIGG